MLCEASWQSVTCGLSHGRPTIDLDSSMQSSMLGERGCRSWPIRRTSPAAACQSTWPTSGGGPEASRR
eukprot:7582552-Prorocentrum_lima.AAC.1